jgi:hypothetical protein
MGSRSGRDGLGHSCIILLEEAGSMVNFMKIVNGRLVLEAT